MRDYLSIGPTPVDEPCEQLGDKYDPYKAKAECRAFANQLRRQFPDIPPRASFGVKGFPHDFGTYYEVVVYFDDTDEESTEYAFHIEGDTPCNWDEEARRELNLDVELQA